MLTSQAEVARYRDALKWIHRLLAYGIQGCPTDGQYHARSYVEARDIAANALGIGAKPSQDRPVKFEA